MGFHAESKSFVWPVPLRNGKESGSEERIECTQIELMLQSVNTKLVLQLPSSKAYSASYNYPIQPSGTPSSRDCWPVLR